jgi:hypothetical protein
VRPCACSSGARWAWSYSCRSLSCYGLGRERRSATHTGITACSMPFEYTLLPGQPNAYFMTMVVELIGHGKNAETLRSWRFLQF